MDVQTDFALPYLKTYVTPLKPGTKRGSHMLACQLVWAASVIRLSRNRLQFSRDMADIDVTRVAQSAQLRFIQQFPEWEEWAKVLDLPHG